MYFSFIWCCVGWIWAVVCREETWANLTSLKSREIVTPHSNIQTHKESEERYRNCISFYRTFSCWTLSLHSSTNSYNYVVWEFRTTSLTPGKEFGIAVLWLWKAWYSRAFPNLQWGVCHILVENVFTRITKLIVVVDLLWKGLLFQGAGIVAIFLSSWVSKPVGYF